MRNITFFGTLYEIKLNRAESFNDILKEGLLAKFAGLRDCGKASVKCQKDK
jgi:hypothetical protein